MPGDAFVGYHDDTAASVVLQVCSDLDEDELYNRFKDKNFSERVRYFEFI